MENSEIDIAKLIVSESNINAYFLPYLKRSLIKIENGKKVTKTEILRLKGEKEYSFVSFKKLVLYPLFLFLKPVSKTPLVDGISSEEITEVAKEYDVNNNLLQDYFNFRRNEQKAGEFVDLWDRHNIRKKNLDKKNMIEGAYCDLILRRISKQIRPLEIVKGLENRLSD